MRFDMSGLAPVCRCEHAGSVRLQASSRWTLSDRPRWQTWSNSLMNRVTLQQLANSSTTTKKRWQRGLCPRSRYFSYSATPDRAPAAPTFIPACRSDRLAPIDFRSQLPAHPADELGFLGHVGDSGSAEAFPFPGRLNHL